MHVHALQKSSTGAGQREGSAPGRRYNRPPLCVKLLWPSFRVRAGGAKQSTHFFAWRGLVLHRAQKQTCIRFELCAPNQALQHAVRTICAKYWTDRRRRRSSQRPPHAPGYAGSQLSCPLPWSVAETFCFACRHSRDHVFKDLAAHVLMYALCCTLHSPRSELISCDAGLAGGADLRRSPASRPVETSS